MIRSIQDQFDDKASMMEAPVKKAAEYSFGGASLVQPRYLDLRTLSVYSSCSVRWLRDRLVDRMCPLPHHRVGGKLLVSREDFDQWMQRFRSVNAEAGLDRLVDEVMTGLVVNTSSQAARSR